MPPPRRNRRGSHCSLFPSTKATGASEVPTNPFAAGLTSDPCGYALGVPLEDPQSVTPIAGIPALHLACCVTLGESPTRWAKAQPPGAWGDLGGG